MKKLILVAVVSMMASISMAQGKTGELGCLLNGPGADVIRNKVDLLQNADGTGGVGKVEVEGFGIKCAASGFAKFGKKMVFSVAITTKSGEVVRNNISNADSGTLSYGDDVMCLCLILDAK